MLIDNDRFPDIKRSVIRARRARFVYPVCGGAAKLAFVLTGESPVGGGAQMPP